MEGICQAELRSCLVEKAQADCRPGGLPEEERRPAAADWARAGRVGAHLGNRCPTSHGQFVFLFPSGLARMGSGTGEASPAPARGCKGSQEAMRVWGTTQKGREVAGRAGEAEAGEGLLKPQRENVLFLFFFLKHFLCSGH